MLTHDKSSLVALRDDYLNKAANDPRESYQRVMLNICVQIERVMCGEGSESEVFAVKQRLEDFLKESQ